MRMVANIQAINIQGVVIQWY